VPSDLDANGEPIKTTGDVSIGFMMTALLNDGIDTLKSDYGVTVYRELICPKKNLQNISVTARREGSATVFEFQGVEDLRDQQISWERKKENCYLEKIFPRNKDGQTWAEFSGQIASVGQIVSDTILVLMLAVFILLERPEGRTIQGDHKVMQKIEDMVKNYISLKTALSAVTGILVAIILELCSVKMGIIFGFLSMLLNFIPNVGSMIAMVLPVPLIILDDNVTLKSVALLGPAAVQGYVGNVLEPAVFGASLNITAMAVLLGLVFFSATWGLPGAVLSVPLLGAVKITLHHTDHPMAKYFLVLIREDPTIP
jgi:predicted PurR-regulated permease PerM